MMRVRASENGDVRMFESEAPTADLAEAESEPEHAAAPPSGVAHDPKAFELMRVWATSEGQKISMLAAPDGDPAFWGGELAELALKIAQLYREHAGAPVEATLEGIRRGLIENWPEANKLCERGGDN